MNECCWFKFYLGQSNFHQYQQSLINPFAISTALWTTKREKNLRLWLQSFEPRFIRLPPSIHSHINTDLKMAPCLDLWSSFCAGWRFAEQGEPPASPGAHLQSADYGHHHFQQIHLQQHCIHQPTIFAMHCNCHYHQIIITNKIILTTRVIIRTFCCRNCSSSWPSLLPNWRGSLERSSTKMLGVRSSDWGLSPSPCWQNQSPWWNRCTFS